MQIPTIYSKALPVHHISEGVERTKDYIDKRVQGLINPLRTFSKKLNEKLEGGIEWHRIMTIAGLSGSGKSIALEQIKRHILRENEDVLVLSFEFEMMIEDQLIRRLTAEKDVSSKEILSGKESHEELEAYKNERLFFVDKIGTVSEIVDTVRNFCAVTKDAGVLVTIDHTVLTKGKQGDKEKEVVDDLMQALVELKKEMGEQGRRITFIVLSQLNRDIEDASRVVNPYLHYPTKNDIFCSSAVYYCSDYVIITHKPSDINGILNTYGPPRGAQFPMGLPVRAPDTNKAMIYWHIIKDRFGEKGIVPFTEDFKHSKVLEYEFKLQE